MTSDYRPDVITIDGPSWSGKKTMALLVADRLGFKYLDATRIYELIALVAIDRNYTPSEEDISVFMEDDFATAKFDPACIWDKTLKVELNGVDVTSEIHKAETVRMAEQLAKYDEIVGVVRGLMRRLATQHHVVLAGPSSGSTVVPSADLNIWLTAPINERVRRRTEKTFNPWDSQETYLRYRSRLMNDDYRLMRSNFMSDSPSDDSIIIDSGALDADEVADLICLLARSRNLGRSRVAKPLEYGYYLDGTYSIYPVYCNRIMDGGRLFSSVDELLEWYPATNPEVGWCVVDRESGYVPYCGELYNPTLDAAFEDYRHICAIMDENARRERFM